MIYKKQCRIDKGSVHIITWIDEKFAKRGKEVEIEFDDTLKERGWFVTEVYKKRFDEKYLKERERDYLKTRQASDI